ncbi:hypothetical protein [Anaerosoma tenue]|uniref:hypothetical protein n=1 Tax=Anaerosoma tenue TaxID=2933588 RepID=UPI002260ED33|nr:hypothetical protein [Anaerosoma tenue]MCK8114794.1 hypothetical protein [Anaerosoma tenue]
MVPIKLDWSFDYGMEFLDHACQLVDQALRRHYKRVESDFDLADQLDIPELIEYVIGLGFAACQGYITGVCSEMSVSKTASLDVGRCHPTGATIARLTNHAANWWKHCDEWSEPLSSSAQRTHDGLVALGVQDSYPLTNALQILTSMDYPLFGDLVPQLSAWRDSVLDEASPYDRTGG